MFYKDKTERGSDCTIGSLLRTQPEKGLYKDVREDELEAKLNTEQVQEQNLKHEPHQKGKVTLSRDDGPDAL